MAKDRMIVPGCPPKKHKWQSMRDVETEAHRVEVIRHGLCPISDHTAQNQFLSHERKYIMHSLQRIEYRRGMLEKGMQPEDLPISVWHRAMLPKEILQAIIEEDLFSLAGVYGDPQVGDPVEYDYLKLVLNDQTVEITFYNRGITLLFWDDERFRRIHRVLCKLR